MTVALLHWSTQRGNVPLLGRHAPAAERHAGRFEALVAEVAAGEAGDAPVGDPGPAGHGEIDAIFSAGPSSSFDAALMAELREFYEEEGG